MEIGSRVKADEAMMRVVWGDEFESIWENIKDKIGVVVGLTDTWVWLRWDGKDNIIDAPLCMVNEVED